MPLVFMMLFFSVPGSGGVIDFGTTKVGQNIKEIITFNNKGPFEISLKYVKNNAMYNISPHFKCVSLCNSVRLKI